MKPLDYFWDTPAEGEGRFPQRFATFIMGLVRLLFTPLFRFRAFGRDAVRDLPEGVILCGNHRSYLDPLFVLLALRPRTVRFIAKDAFFRIPVIGRLASYVGPFPINREGVDTKAIKRAVAMLKRGEMVGIFPEGTRLRGVSSDSPGTTPTGSEQQAREGIALIASRARAQVVPFHLWGAERISPPGKRLWRFPRVTLAFGEPLSLDDPRYSDLDKSERYKRFSQDCLDAVYAIENPRAEGKIR